MPDQYDPKVAPRAPGRRSAPGDDPLAELAKIVHGRSTVATASAAKPSARPQSTNGAAATDLEAELLNDLQASFAAVREALPQANLTSEPAPSRPAPAQTTARVAAPIPSAPLRGPIVEDTPPASVTPPLAAPQPQNPAPRASAPPRPEAHPELRDEFRLEPIDETRLVPIPSPPVIQPPQIQTQPASEYQPPARAERLPPAPQPQAPPPAPEKATDPGVERAPRIARPTATATTPEAPSDLANFTIRSATRSAAASAPPAAAPSGAKQPHSRWEKPEPPKAQPSAPSRFAPPKSAVPADDAGGRDPFADAGLLPAGDGEAALDTEFALDGLGMVPGYGDDDDGDMLPPLDDDFDAMSESRGPRRGLVIAGAVAVVALLGGVAVAMYHSGSTSSVAGTPPVITADNSPTKVVPKPATADNSDSPNKLIYDRVNSAASSSTSDDTTLVTSGDEPIKDVPSSTSSDNAITRVIIPGGPQGPVDSGTAGASAPDNGAQVAAADTSDDALGPRKVRTVVVKPDGTIVSSQATDAPPPPPDTGAAAPAVPPAPDATAAAPSSTAAAPPPAPVPAPVPATPPATTSNDAARVTDDTSAIAGGGQAGPLAITDQPDTSGGTTTLADNSAQATAPALPAPTVPKPAPKPTVKQPPANAQVADSTAPIDVVPGAAPTPVPAGGALVQISSQRTEDAARATYKDLQARYPTILGRYDVNIQRADLGDRGIFYRVRVGPFSQADAQHLCDDLRSAGGDCVLATK